MPKALASYLGYAIYFWLNEGNPTEPIHVHVSKGRQTVNATKIWITKSGVRLAHNDSKIPDSELRRILAFIDNNRNEVIAKWAIRFEEISFYRD